MDEDDFFDTNKITVQTKARTGRKLMTLVYGLGKEYDTEKILKHFKKTFHCTGSVVKDEKFGEVITLTGNQKQDIIRFFITEGIATIDNIIAKGV